MLPFTVHPVGDCALLAGFTQRIAPEIGAALRFETDTVFALTGAESPAVLDSTPVP